jgi:inosine-uridine nucleoside N-ribohydrolase
MARKVILDVDPGIDDAVAMCLALFDPRLDVVAVTAVAGNVPPAMATRNVETVIEQLDPPRWPRIGAAGEEERVVPEDRRFLNGPDGLGNGGFPVAELHHIHPSERVIADEIRSAREEITIVALGPLTNIAAVFRREPALASQCQLVIAGGTVSGPGNVTPAAEFNFYSAPQSAREVLRSPSTKTLLPLDVTRQVPLTFDFLDQLPDEATRAGRFLRRILPYAFRSHREYLGLEAIHLHDVVALAAVAHPELFQTSRMAGDVETSGELTAGAAVFDRRPNPQWRPNMDVATTTEPSAVMDYILRGLAEAGRRG